MNSEPIVCVIDTNVVVAGLITGDPASPTARILDRMLDGSIIFLLSQDLLSEYRAVLKRPKISQLHALSDEQIDTLLTEFVSNAIWCEPTSSERAPDAGDDHLWALLVSYEGSLLVTGDQLLVNAPPENHTVISARSFVNRSPEA